eukprot:scaffold128746_cov22-Tisochrysis_lutea.AAC.1
MEVALHVFSANDGNKMQCLLNSARLRLLDNCTTQRKGAIYIHHFKYPCCATFGLNLYQRCIVLYVRSYGRGQPKFGVIVTYKDICPLCQCHFATCLYRGLQFIQNCKLCSYSSLKQSIRGCLAHTALCACQASDYNLNGLKWQALVLSQTFSLCIC